MFSNTEMNSTELYNGSSMDALESQMDKVMEMCEELNGKLETPYPEIDSEILLKCLTETLVKDHGLKKNHVFFEKLTAAFGSVWSNYEEKVRQLHAEEDARAQKYFEEEDAKNALALKETEKKIQSRELNEMREEEKVNRKVFKAIDAEAKKLAKEQEKKAKEEERQAQKLLKEQEKLAKEQAKEAKERERAEKKAQRELENTEEAKARKEEEKKAKAEEAKLLKEQEKLAKEQEKARKEQEKKAKAEEAKLLKEQEKARKEEEKKIKEQEREAKKLAKEQEKLAKEAKKAKVSKKEEKKEEVPEQVLEQEQGQEQEEEEQEQEEKKVVIVKNDVDEKQDSDSEDEESEDEEEEEEKAPEIEYEMVDFVHDNSNLVRSGLIVYALGEDGSTTQVGRIVAHTKSDKSKVQRICFIGASPLISDLRKNIIYVDETAKIEKL